MLWLLFPCTWVAIAILLDRFGHRHRPFGPFDALVVPGCAVRQDGTASGALRRRTEHAVALWHDGIAPLIVLTGGVGKFPPSEAHAAAAIAEAAGVPTNALVLEAASTTTAENAALAAETVPNADMMSVLVVTDSYHAWRCRHLFRRHFHSADAIGSTPSQRLRIRGALREVASIGSMFLKGASNA
jgi:uncharacterized SAM-binding protein YcdF (DUF218 family)